MEVQKDFHSVSGNTHFVRVAEQTVSDSHGHGNFFLLDIGGRRVARLLI
jgi:hypothetical protein